MLALSCSHYHTCQGISTTRAELGALLAKHLIYIANTILQRRVLDQFTVFACGSTNEVNLVTFIVLVGISSAQELAPNTDTYTHAWVIILIENSRHIRRKNRFNGVLVVSSV